MEAMWNPSKKWIRPYGKYRLMKKHVLTSELRLYLLAYMKDNPSTIHLAELAGVDPRQVYRIKMGRTRFTEIKTAEKLMDAMDYDLYELKTVYP